MSLQSRFDKAVSLHRQGKLKDAERSYQEILGEEPTHYDALLMLGIIAFQTQRPDLAIELQRKAAAANPNIPDAHSNLGNALLSLERPEEAIASFDKSIALHPEWIADDYNQRGNALLMLGRCKDALSSFDNAIALRSDFANAHRNRGYALVLLDRRDEALASYDIALLLDPNLTDAWIGRGNILVELKKYEEATAAYDKALSLQPDSADAWLGRGNVLSNLKRYEDAFTAYDKALSLKSNFAEAWLGRGNALYDLGRHDEAYAAFTKSVTLNPTLANAWCGLGNVCFDLNRYDEAIAAYDRALTLNSQHAAAWVGRGNVYFDLKRVNESINDYDKAVSLKPDLAEAWLGSGNVLFDRKRYDDAFKAYDKAYALKPDLISVEGARLHAKMFLCDWTNYDAESSHLVGSVKDGRVIVPWSLLSIDSTVEDQFHCAKVWVQKKCPPSNNPLWKGEPYKHDKIRICYVSSDFVDHPVARLMGGVFECHDRSRFETTAISLSPSDNSSIRQRLERSFDQFIDTSAFDSESIAKKIKAMEIDILIDLNGFTKNARTEIFASRPAPLQVNYLGYAGTMGASYIDYTIADPVVIPTSQRSSYQEKIVYLPPSYMPHDEKARFISEQPIEREDFGLPENGFVFCCFNLPYKINPHIFRPWMRVLKAVDGSVLWLSDDNVSATNNIRKEAAQAGIAPDRIIFAKRLPSPADHLARYRLADLFLDPLPYNSHTTAGDALWTGLPVLTCLGQTFVGRGAASQLTAIGLPELITPTLKDYAQTAIDLASDGGRLNAIRAKLTENKSTSTLFNTGLFTRRIEAAYLAIYERRQAGASPDHIFAPS